MGREITWTGSIDTVAARLGAFILLAGAVVVVTAGRGVAEPGRAQLACGVLLVAQLALVALCLTRLRRGPTRLALPATLLGGVTLVAATVAAASPGIPAFAVSLLPSNAVQATHVVAIVFVPHLGRACAMLLATCPAYLLADAVTLDQGTPLALEDWILPAGTSFTLLVLRALMRVRAGELDDADRRAREISAATAALTAAELAADESRRLLHDEVVSALRCVELGVERDDLEGVARSTLAALAGSARVTNQEAVLRALVDAAPVRVRPVSEDWSDMPPPRVAAAITAATAEALRNVARHAGVDEAEVRVAGDAHRCVVEVRDDGRGLPDPASEGFGIRESIVGRMEDVGGVARVSSDAAGTTVRLEWPAPRGPAAPRVAGLLGARTSRTNAILVLPAALANTYVAVRNLGESPAPGSAVLVGMWLLYAALATSVGTGAPRSGRLVALLVGAWSVTALGLLVQPSGALLGLGSWVVGAVGTGLALVAFHRGWRWALLAGVGQVGVVLTAAALDPGVSLTAPVGAIVTPVWQLSVATLPGYWLRRAERRIAETERSQQQEVQERAWDAASEQSRRTHLVHLESDVVPFLRAVSAGRTWPERDEVARLLGAQCRDDLVLAEPMPEQVRAAVRGARHRGVSVVIRPSSTRATVTASAWAVLVDVLGAAGEGHLVTLSPPRSDRHATRVAVVPALTSPLPPGHRVVASHGPGRTLVEVPPHAGVSPDEATGGSPRVSDGLAR